MRATSGRVLVPVIIFMVLVLAVGIGVDSSVAAKSFEPCKLTILFTGDDQGNIKPCG